ncbi:hypothetical protein FJZ53_07275 [Candidatus Woesearchaeota archaeon]|nr:hypothetical protein [Candidatus Woesearchaeota archaeon]
MDEEQPMGGPLAQQDEIDEMIVGESFYPKYKPYLIIILAVLITVSLITILEIIYKQSLSNIKPLMLNIMMVASWFFGLTISGIIRHLLSIKQFQNKPYLVFEREKNFIRFLIKIVLLFLATSLAIWLTKMLFQHFFYFIHLLLVEWLLIVYIWFCVENKYKFPWFFTVVINLILLANAYIINIRLYV